MADLSDIIESYLITRKNKRKSPDQVAFELHWEMGCVKLCDDVNNRAVRPTAYTFVTKRPRPREIFASCFEVRILHHYLDMRLRPLLERRLGEHTYNNRIGRGQQACQNAVISNIYEATKGYTRDAWIIKLDIKGCFPNINQDIAYKMMEKVVLKDYHGADIDDVIYILQVCIFSYPTHHCTRKGNRKDWALIPPEKSLFNKPDGIGAAIGHLVWQNTVNYYFVAMDDWLDKAGVLHERYVDDNYIVTANKEVFLSMISELRKLLAGLGAKLNENKFYCQHYSKGVECLGVHIKMRRVYVNSRIVNRAKRAAKRLNKRIDADHVDRLLAVMNSYIGLCKCLNGYKRIVEILTLLSPKWREYVYLNRRRMCFSPLPQYTQRNRIIHKYNLK